MPTDYETKAAEHYARVASQLSALLGLPVMVDRHGMARVNADALLAREQYRAAIAFVGLQHMFHGPYRSPLHMELSDCTSVTLTSDAPFRGECAPESLAEPTVVTFRDTSDDTTEKTYFATLRDAIEELYGAPLPSYLAQ